MDVLRTLLARLRLLPRRRRAAAEVDEEFALHLDLEAARLVAAGVPPAEARRRARLAFGGVERHREAMRAGQRVPLLETVVRDVRHALRSLRRAPAFTGAAVLTLALGMGAAGAVFTVVDAVLLRPLPYPEPERIHTLWEPYGDGRTFGITEPEALELPGRVPAFEHVGVWARGPFNLLEGGEPEQVTGAVASAGLFPALGIGAAHGRVYGTAEDVPGRDAVVLLSHGLWQRRFGGDPTVLGQAVRLDGRVRTVIGVMPPDFSFPDPAVQLWVPRAIDPAGPELSSRYLRAVVRLRRGTDAAALAPELTRAAAALAADIPLRYGSRNNADGFNLVPLRETVVGSVRSILVLLLAGVLLVLLVACANVANLLLARHEARRHELAVRAALGGARMRLLAFTVTESLVLSAAAGALAVLLAWAGVRAFAALAPAEFPRMAEVAVGGATLAATAAAVALTGAGFGLVTALAGRGHGATALLRGSRGATGGTAARRFRSALVVAQLALALALLGDAGLLLRTLHALSAEAPGVDAAGVLTGRFFVPQADYPTAGAVQAFAARLAAAVEEVPGVAAAGLVDALPMTGGYSVAGWRLPGQASPEDETPPQAHHLTVTPGYLDALGVPLLRGRTLVASDTAGPRVILVSEALAREAWPGEPALGRGLHLGGPDTLLHTVVGVVGDVLHHGPGRPAPPTVYFPHRTYPWGEVARGFALVVRAADQRPGVLGDVRAALQRLDPTLPLADVRSMEEIVAAARARPRLATVLLGAFAGVGLLIAGAGVYGVLAYTVSRRRREWGIRMALGAAPAAVRRQVLRDTAWLVLAGSAAGALLFAAMAAALRGLLWGVSPTDPPALAGAAALLVAVALAAGSGPARRASRVDAAVTLREE